MENLKDLILTNSIILQDDLSECMTVLDSEKLDLYTDQWEYNRNLNLDKVNQIKEVVKNKMMLDTVLHICYDVRNNKLIVFDGNHRREALILLHKTLKLNIKVCCYIYILDVPDINKEIFNKFKIVNQMTPIPDMYYDILEQLGNEQELVLMNKKDIIEEVFAQYKTSYKPFYSVKSKCRRPNFNDTTFKDLCNNLEFKNKDELVNHLCSLNKQKSECTAKLSETINNKCETYNFYLFS